MELFPPPTPPPPPPGVDYDPSPPGYEAGSSSSTPTIAHAAQAADIFFDCVPRADQTSFQVGYLGLDGFQAWVKGDVLVKLDAEAQPAFDRCTVSFTAVESVGLQSVTLFSSSQSLWEAAPSASSRVPLPPSTMPFSFPLTSDLPHCVHLAQSGLLYELVARLHSLDQRVPDVLRSTPVHLTRYTRPGPIASLDAPSTSAVGAARESGLRFSAAPYVWYLETPTPLSIQLGRTLFRRAEPMEVRVRIPPPSSNLVSEKGLRLRSVEAELVRVIHARNNEAPASLSAEGKERETSDQDAPLYSPGIMNDASTSSSTSKPSLNDAEHAALTASSSNSVEAILAHSGKLCRFHSRSSILLRLALHPPFDVSNMPFPHPDHDAAVGGRGPMQGRGGGGGCESISQETLLHDVRFLVRIKVSMRGGAGEKRDVIVEREVRVLPGAAGAGLPVKVVNSEEQSIGCTEEAAATRENQSQDKAAGSSSNETTTELFFQDFSSDEEYDGYEDVGRSLGDGESSGDEEDDAVTARLPSMPSFIPSGSGNSAGSSSAPGGTSTGDTKSTAALPSSSSENLHSSQLARFRASLARDSSPSPVGAIHSSAPSRAEDPPPSILESRNDVQLEVEVAGVGFAMPRTNAARRGSGHTLRARNAQDEQGFAAYDEQPPPLDEDIRHYENRDTWRGTTSSPSVTHTQSPLDDYAEAPPPLSPPPPLSAHRTPDERPAYTADASSPLGLERNAAGEAQALHPPPYIPAPPSGAARSAAHHPTPTREAPPPSHAEATNYPPAYPEAPSPLSALPGSTGTASGAPREATRGDHTRQEHEAPRRSTSLRVARMQSGAGPPSYEA